eukprot:TRINITY_DN2479_c0_g1_i11.p1 TRINITY_DN2479_c0_g1~~TRINITY_DN2479_c0_g1_i11.p1  ORF type:complete len:726 (+),score=170.98 TRINITY_DN2479_c0_g1_i11:274-2451(+)
MAKCQANNQKGLPCPLPALEGKDSCHSHTKLREKEEKKRVEDAERATRGVKLCSGGCYRKCPDANEIPITNKSSLCDSCTKLLKQQSSVNRAKREELVAQRNKEKEEEGLLECKHCHRDLPLDEFKTERKKTVLRLGVSEERSDRCRECREKAKTIVAASMAKHGKGPAPEEPKPSRPARRMCSRHGKVNDGCWGELPDNYDGLTCEPCIKLLRAYNEWKRQRREQSCQAESGGSSLTSAGLQDCFEEVVSKRRKEGRETEEHEENKESRESQSKGLKPKRKAAGPRGKCAAVVRTSGKPCTNAAAPDSKYCNKHYVEGVRDEVLERGGQVCAMLFENYKRGCQKELPKDSKFKRCENCRALDKASVDGCLAKKREEALAEVACFKKKGVLKKMCMNPKCCKVKDPSEFVFQETGERQGWCTECREKRQEYVSKLPGGKRKRTEQDRETARAYERSEKRKEAKLAFKEANPERVVQYSRDSRERRRAADPEGFLARNAADQARHRNRVRIITFDGDETLEPTTAEQLIEAMDSCCFFCGVEHTHESPLGVQRLDLTDDWAIDNCVPSCTLCWAMRKKVDARTFVERCVYLKELKDGGARATFPDELFGDHPGAGEYTGYLGSARQRGIPFNLTKDQFYEQTSGDCYICGKRNTSSHSNGLDRVDSKGAYTLENTKSACGNCNYMKADLALATFFSQINAVAARASITLEYIPANIRRITHSLLRN